MGFRAFVQRMAAAHGVSGEVWNQREGGVELIAQHPQAAVLDAFLKALRNGPGRVTSISVLETAPGSFDGFTVGHTR